jgi:hypothetical protein
VLLVFAGSHTPGRFLMSKPQPAWHQSGDIGHASGMHRLLFTSALMVYTPLVESVTFRGKGVRDYREEMDARSSFGKTSPRGLRHSGHPQCAACAMWVSFYCCLGCVPFGN